MNIEDDGSPDEVPARVCGWIFDDATEHLLAKCPALSEDYFRDQIVLTPEPYRQAFIAQLVREYRAMLKVEQSSPEPAPEACVGEIYQQQGGTVRYFEIVDVAAGDVFVRVLPGFRYRTHAGQVITGPVRGVFSGGTFRARMTGTDELTVFGLKRRLTAKRYAK